MCYGFCLNAEKLETNNFSFFLLFLLIFVLLFCFVSDKIENENWSVVFFPEDKIDSHFEYFSLALIFYCLIILLLVVRMCCCFCLVDEKAEIDHFSSVFSADEID